MSEAVGERIRAAAAEVRAPQGLHDRVEAERLEPPPRRWRVATAATAVAAAGLVAVSIAGLLGGGSDRPRGVGGAVDLALAAPELPAGAGTSIDGLTFPARAYEDSWRQVGRREDRVGGRRALTVIYGRGTERVGYTIVASPALAVPAGAPRVRRGRITYAVLGHGDRAAVTWQRNGHTCVLAGRGIPVERLLAFVPS